MKNLTITLPEETFARLRVAAAQEGKSMSKFMAELVDGRLGRAKSQRQAIDEFLAGPLMNLTDENGQAPTRDEIYDRSRFR